MENTGLLKEKEVRRWTLSRAVAQDTRASPKTPNSLKTHLVNEEVRGHWTPTGCVPMDVQKFILTGYEITTTLLKNI